MYNKFKIAIMADELIDIYNEDNESFGSPKMKSEAHRGGLWHRASHVWIYNDKGEILLQLRSKEKELNPDRWDVSAAGHIQTGEEPIDAAIRETKEEIGLAIDLKDLDFLKIRKIDEVVGNIKNKEFQYIYIFKFNGDLKDLVLQEEEVSEVRFAAIIEIEEGLKSSPEKYVRHGNGWFEIMVEVRRRSECCDNKA
jgi:isopentenyldiphosphate isomerase